MKGKTKSKILACCSLLAFASFCAAVSVTQIQTEAEPSNFVMLNGASVRKVDPYGIRFEALIDETLYTEVVNDENKSFGMLIVPQRYVADYEEYKAANVEYTGTYYEYFKDVKGKMIDLTYETEQIVKKDTVVGGNTYEYLIRGSNTNILFNNLALDFVGMGYIKTVHGEAVSYEYATMNDNARTVAYVASAALNAGETGDALEKILTNTAYGIAGVTYNGETGKYIYNDSSYDTLEETGIDLSSIFAMEQSEVKLSAGEDYQLTLNANLQGFNVKWSSDNENITVVDGKVTANAYGDATVTATIGQYSATCKIIVEKSKVALYDGARQDVDMSLETVTFELPSEHTVTNESTLTVNGNEVAFTLTDNVVSVEGAALSALKLYGENMVTITTEKNVYTLNALLISKIIYTKADLNQMAEMIEASKTDAYTFTLKNEATIYKTSGYFVLGDDIDYNWETWIGPASGGFFSRQAYLNTNNGLGAYSAYGFNGVFDGRGHTISNVTFQTSRINWNNAKGSMFGAIGQNGRVENVNITGTMSGSATGVFGSACFGTIEDVQVTMMPHGTNTYAVDTEYDGGVICCLVQAATIKNVVTKVLGDARGLDACFGVVFATAYSNGNGLTLDNIYSVVIGKYVNRRDSSESAMSWGTQTSTAYQVPNTLMGALVDAGNAGFYTTEEAAKAATGIDVTGFDAEYWTIPTTGIPVFKTEDVSF